MKKTKLALAVSATIFATSAMATNGTNMTGVGAQSSAMGGTGVAAYYGAENVVVNPGMIGKGTGTEFSFGGTLFTPKVSNNGLGMGPGTQKDVKSDADKFVIPSVSLTSRINDSLTFGIGMYGTSGMGVDYSSNEAFNPAMPIPNQFEAKSNLQIMRFVPTLAFNQDNFGIGFSPIVQYGSLDINYYDGDPNGLVRGAGVSDDLGFGYSLGGYFDITEDFTVAASYTSKISMEYDNQLSSASAGFLPPADQFSDKLDQPAEIKVGAAYKIDNFTLTADVKKVKWSSTNGYGDFGWEDQNVIALGAKYQGENYWLGAGFNRGKNPIKQQDGTTYNGAVTNMFNNMFFPAITDKHYSIGGGYALTKAVTIDAAIVIAPTNKTTVDTTGVSSMFAGGPLASSNTTKHSQRAYTISARYNF